MDKQGTRPAVITKSAPRVRPNWTDYPGLRRDFSWSAMRRELGVPPSGGMNIGWAALDRHAEGEQGHRTALRLLSYTGQTALSYAELAALANRFANVLRGLDVQRGERVFLMLPRMPALYIAALGALKAGKVVCPLFSAFGPEPLATRMSLGDARVLVTTPLLYRRRVSQVRASLPGLRHVLLVDCRPGDELLPAVHDFDRMLSQADAHFEPVATAGTDPALLHFTSGTTGTPKGALHVHDAVLMHWMTGRYALDLHPDDIYWCTADPGWVTGTSYGLIAPLLHGVTSLVDVEEFDASRWYEILRQEEVSVWYTAPTAIRMLMKAGALAGGEARFPQLRFIASVGEPLNPEAVWWGMERFGIPIHDNWWQTETGGIMIANTPAFDIKPGSMGRPLPGVDACIVERDSQGALRVLEQPGAQGELALRRGWPSMFSAYLNNEERYRKCFAGDWYLSGDLASCDADGYFWFVGRSDDVIKTAGHLVGPFEVESALMEHPAVAEAGVIGKPDPTMGERIKAFVTLREGVAPSPELQADLLAHARLKLGAAIAPRELDFLAVLPRTRSGKIMRRLLKARELGLPEGDLSTLEAGA